MQYLIVDGYALAHRAWHAYPELTNDKGRETQVTVGFFKQLVSRVSNLDSYQLIFVFDSPGGSFRNSMDSSYKANRGKQRDAFYEQIDEVVRLCKMIAPTYQIPGFEADDLAGSFVSQFVGPDDEARLLTVDGDWLQLLQKNVTVQQLKTTGPPVFWTRELFFERYSGLKPAQLVDLKALTGDDSDNIPGLKGCGWVTANKLLSLYGTVENIYDNILRVTNKGGVQVSLMENKERVLLNKELAQIKKDVSMPEPVTSECKSDEFLDYLVDELNAENLANLMGVYFQTKRG